MATELEPIGHSAGDRNLASPRLDRGQAWLTGRARCTGPRPGWRLRCGDLLLASCSGTAHAGTGRPERRAGQIQAGDSRHAVERSWLSDQGARRVRVGARTHASRQGPALYGLPALQRPRQRNALRRQQGFHRLFLRRPSQSTGRSDAASNAATPPTSRFRNWKTSASRQSATRRQQGPARAAGRPSPSSGWRFPWPG